MKANDSTFLEDTVLTYDGETFDTKYCFMFQGDQKKIAYGENPYDRKATVSISVYVFFEEVSIEEINYSLVKDYDAYSFKISELYKQSVNELTIEGLQYEDWKVEYNRYVRKIHFDKKTILTIESSFFGEKEILFSDEIISTILLQGKMIKLN